jgi:hypothetical protein
VFHGVNLSGDAGDAQSLSLRKEEREEEGEAAGETKRADHSSHGQPQPGEASPSVRVLEEARGLLARLSDVEASRVLGWVRAMEGGLAHKKHQAEGQLRAFLEQWRSSTDGQGGMVYA